MKVLKSTHARRGAEQYIALFAVFLLASLLLCNKSAFAAVLIKNAVLIDGTGSAARAGMSILIERDRITQVTTDAVDAEDLQVINAQGLTVLPGMIDAHFHQSFLIRNTNYDDSFLDPANREFILNNSIQSEKDMKRFLDEDFPKRARALLEMGITSLVDPGGFWPYSGKMRDRIREKTVVGPRSFVAGPIITAPGATHTLVPGSAWYYNHFIVASNDNDLLRGAVRSLAAEGVDGLKLAYGKDGGSGTTWSAPGGLTETNLQVIVDEAHRLNLPVTAHIWKDEIGALEGVRANLDAIVHFIPMEGERYRESEKEPGVDLPALLNRHDIEVVTTLYALVSDTANLSWEPGNAASQGNNEALRYIKTRIAPSVRRHLDAGVTLIFGTDHGMFTLKGEFQSQYATYEVQTMQLAGLTPLEIIQTLTGNAAKHPMVPDDIGTVEVGKRADLILLQEDPVEDVTRMFQPVIVILDGQIVVDKRAPGS